jgi:transcription elongation factor Elf1
MHERRRVRTREVRKKVFAYLRANPCVDCGEEDIAVLEFDHRCRVSKQDRVSALVCQGYSWETVKTEIDKCDVRCANCHRRRTAIQLGWYAAKAARKKRA